MLYTLENNGENAVEKDYKISLLLDYYGALLTDKQREMIEYYYNDDLSLSEIAENYGITRQGVRDFIKRAEAQLNEFEEKTGFYKYFNQNADVMNEISLICENIKQDIKQDDKKSALMGAEKIINIINNEKNKNG